MIQANRDFAARLARINSGKQYEAVNVVGQRSMQVYKKAKERGRFKPKPKVSLMRELLITPVAIGFGLLAVLAARVAWFHLISNEMLPENIAGFGAQAEAALALAAFLLLVLAFKLRSGTRLYAVVAGFAFMAFGENAFAETLPNLWTSMFSADYYTNVVQGATLAASLL